jgi:hypothetical protein
MPKLNKRLGFAVVTETVRSWLQIPGSILLPSEPGPLVEAWKSELVNAINILGQ